MNLMSLVRRSLRQHALSSFVTIVSVALAAGQPMSVFAINSQTYDAFTGGKVGFDAVLGARGSQLQLVLNTVFHLETSPGNIPWSLHKEISEDPRVTLAIPYAAGDNYQGYRIVGTTREMFTKFTYREGRGFVLKPGGRVFDESKKDAILGHYVAEKLGLTLGSTFTPYHGLQFSEREKHRDEYTGG